MKLAGVYFVLACLSAFAQQNAAGDAIQKRIEGMNLLQPPRPLRVVRLNPPLAPAPGVCSVPLLNALPSGAEKSPMPIQQPRDTGDRNTASVPAPECK